MIHRISNIPENDRLLELLADNALVGLSTDERTELRRLADSLGVDADTLAEEWELIAGDLSVGLSAADESMPADLMASCVAAGEAWMEGGSRDAVMAEPKPVYQDAPRPIRFNPEGGAPRGRSAWTGWLVAAALALVAGVSLFSRPSLPGAQPVVTLASQREALLESDPGAIKLDWMKWGEAYAEVTGTVVWSQERQEGYMTFKGLPTNDPNVEQYQLWIVDGSRGVPLEVPPVDGGVFDIDPAGIEVLPETGEMIVRIEAKLPVGQPVAFGITLEKPGGAVVSERKPEQLVVVQFVPQA